MKHPFHTDPLPEEGKHNPFSVPENYFENFPSRLQDKISQSSATTWNLKPVFAVMLLLILVSAVTVMYQPQEKPITLHDITYEEFENSGYISEYSISLLAEQFEIPSDSVNQFEEYLIEYSDEDFFLNAL